MEIKVGEVIKAKREEKNISLVELCKNNRHFPRISVSA